MLRLRLAPLALLLSGAWLAPLVGQTPEEPAAAVERAIALLDDDDYFQRERASRQLLDLGAAAVPALSAAAVGDSLEVTFRSVAVLRELSLSADGDTADAAGQALEALAASPVTSASRRASLALKVHEQKRSERALDDIRAVGGAIVYEDNEYGYTPYIQLNRAWQGGNDLSAFRLARGIVALRFHGAAIGDEALEHLHALESLQRVELYATRVTPAGAAALQSALPNAAIDLRAGAFLGIGAIPGRQPCQVTQVQEDSAAERAGIQTDDIVTRFDGREITDFESLTAIIAEKQGGEEVPIELLRGETTIERTVTLGRWE